MARNRTKPINPFLELLMDSYDMREGERLSLKIVQEQTQESWSSISKLADFSTNLSTKDAAATLKFHLRMSEYFGITLDEWVRGLLGELSSNEIAKIKNQISRAS